MSEQREKLQRGAGVCGSVQEDGRGPSTLKLRHHFFLTWLKIVLKEAFKAPNTVRLEVFFQEELIIASCLLHYKVINLCILRFSDAIIVLYLVFHLEY